MPFKLKELKEDLGDARKRKSDLVDERASKLQDLKAEMMSDDPDTEKEEQLRDEIDNLTEKIENQSDLIEKFTDQLADQAETEGYENDLDEIMGTNNQQPQNDEQREKRMYQLTANILTTLSAKNMSMGEKLDKVGDYQKELAKDGHYDDYVNAVDGFNTLTDKDGGVWMPTTISERIFDFAEEYGVFSEFGLRLPMSTGDGTEKIPNVLGQITFYATSEGGEAKASAFTFSGIALEQKKWMTYIPWTNEMDDLQGRRLVEIILRKIAEALARMRDDAVINADGTSTYNNLVGFVTRSSDSDHPEVRESTAATGNTSFSDIEPDDFLNATLDIAKSVRDNVRIALDPDWRVYLKQMTDANDIPYYANGSGIISVDNGQYMIHDVPVDFTEAVPSTDGAGKTYGVAYVPEYYAFADDGGFIIEQFDTGQIPNEDGTSNAINLLSQDMKAARVKTFFDFEISQITKDDDGTKKGAFTVLKTASS